MQEITNFLCEAWRMLTESFAVKALLAVVAEVGIYMLGLNRRGRHIYARLKARTGVRHIHLPSVFRSIHKVVCDWLSNVS